MALLAASSASSAFSSAAEASSSSLSASFQACLQASMASWAFSLRMVAALKSIGSSLRRDFRWPEGSLLPLCFLPLLFDASHRLGGARLVPQRRQGHLVGFDLRVQRLVVGSALLVAAINLHPAVGLGDSCALRLPPLVSAAVAELLGAVDPALVGPLGDLVDLAFAPVAAVVFAVRPAIAGRAVPGEVGVH
eukprot:11799542-Alexandrium_andersonii.AAC.1